LFKLDVKKGKSKQLWHFITHGIPWRKFVIKRYIKNQGLKKLQIGGGYHTKAGWLNGDLIAGDIYLNAAKKFPFPDATFDVIFAEQFIEHLNLATGLFCLKECNRVLKHGGTIRLSTPDMKKLILFYSDENPEVDCETAMARHKRNHNPRLTTVCHFLNDFFRLWGHTFIYDEETLLLHLGSAGFTNIDRKRFDCSDNPHLQKLEIHADVEWMKNAFQLVLEAEKT